MRITYAQLNEYATKQEGKQDEDTGEIFYFGFDEGDEVHIEHYLSEMTSGTKEVLAQAGFEFDNTGIDLHDFEELKFMKAYSYFVYSVYESQLKLGGDPEYDKAICEHLWSSVLGLGGDDDVDYNGSYLDIVVDVIEGYLKSIKA